MGYLFVYVDWFPLDAALRFSVKENFTKKNEQERKNTRKSDTWVD